MSLSFKKCIERLLPGLVALSLIVPAALWSASAFAQDPSMKSIGSSAVPVQKLLKRFEASKQREVQERHYTYIAEVDCGEGVTAKRAYVLRGDTGNYMEDFCGFLYNGSLAYVSDEPIDLGGTPAAGFRYNGTDEGGEWGYFFGSDDLDGNGTYLVLIGGPFSGPDQPEFFDAQVATRTQP